MQKGKEFSANRGLADLEVSAFHDDGMRFLSPVCVCYPDARRRLAVTSKGEPDAVGCRAAERPRRVSHALSRQVDSRYGVTPASACALSVPGFHQAVGAMGEHCR